MKTRFTLLCLVLSLGCFINASAADFLSVRSLKYGKVVTVEEVFGHFNVHRQQTGILLSWESRSENVESFVVERSYDGNSFEILNTVQPSAAKFNKFKDNMPYLGYSYYRIAAVLSSGEVVYSAIEEVRIVSRKG